MNTVRLPLSAALLTILLGGGWSCGSHPGQPAAEALGGIGLSTLRINGGERVTARALVSLTLAAPNATQMKLSNDPDFSGAGWQPYAHTVVAWTLPAGDGVKTVYAQFGNDLAMGVRPASDTIVLDQTAPDIAGMVSTPPDAAQPSFLPDILAWTAADDALAGVATYRVFLDRSSPPAIEIYAGPHTHCAVAGLIHATSYYWQIAVEDSAGNKATAGPWAFATATISIPAGFVYVEPGLFQMGSAVGEAGRADDEAQHWVQITRPFLLAATEVTQARYEAVMGTNPSHSIGDDHPVESVAWFHAVAFCNALSEAEGLTPAYTAQGMSATWDLSADGYRLPTEAEWEYACRAGTTTRFNSGNEDRDLDAAGWFSGNAGYRTLPVAHRNANGWGLRDMHGNVWEWCWDRYGGYAEGSQTDPVVNPSGAGAGDDRVIRGGCFNASAADCRAANRSAQHTGAVSRLIGIRLARSLF